MPLWSCSTSLSVVGGTLARQYLLISMVCATLATRPPPQMPPFWCRPPPDPDAVVAAQRSVPYAIVGGILALLVFLLICVLVTMVWCSIRQKGGRGREMGRGYRGAGPMGIRTESRLGAGLRERAGPPGEGPMRLSSCRKGRG